MITAFNLKKRSGSIGDACNKITEVISEQFKESPEQEKSRMHSQFLPEFPRSDIKSSYIDSFLKNVQNRHIFSKLPQIPYSNNKSMFSVNSEKSNSLSKSHLSINQKLSHKMRLQLKKSKKFSSSLNQRKDNLNQNQNMKFIKLKNKFNPNIEKECKLNQI